MTLLILRNCLGFSQGIDSGSSNFEIIFSFLFAIVVIFMISNSIISFAKNEEELV
ncbi:MAG: hypothetical protein AB8H03_08775 [Saprospiraceae bacterium]